MAAGKQKASRIPHGSLIFGFCFVVFVQMSQYLLLGRHGALP